MQPNPIKMATESLRPHKYDINCSIGPCSQGAYNLKQWGAGNKRGRGEERQTRTGKTMLMNVSRSMYTLQNKFRIAE